MEIIMIDIRKDINSKYEKIAELEEEVLALEQLFKLYPDLQSKTHRWGRVRYYSKMVNAKCDAYDLGHNCGCCSDSSLELFPYLKTENGNVYSDPPCFTIGERFDYAADREYSGWDDRLRENEIPEWIIKELRDKFEKDANIIKTILEEDDYEDEGD